MPKNRSYTVTFKLQVIQWHRQNGGNVSETARNFNVDRKRVREWMGQEDVLLMHRRGAEAQKKRIGGGASAKSEELDALVLDWLMDERAAGRPVSNKDLMDKARDIARGIPNLGQFFSL